MQYEYHQENLNAICIALSKSQCDKSSSSLKDTQSAILIVFSQLENKVSVNDVIHNIMPKLSYIDECVIVVINC